MKRVATLQLPQPDSDDFQARAARAQHTLRGTDGAQGVCSTPEQKVQDAVANSRLSGYEVTEDVKAVMLRIARGDMSMDQAEAWEDQQVKR